MSSLRAKQTHVGMIVFREKIQLKIFDLIAIEDEVIIDIEKNEQP